MGKLCTFIQQNIYNAFQINECIIITTCIKIDTFQNNVGFKCKLEKTIFHLHRVSAQNNSKTAQNNTRCI